MRSLKATALIIGLLAALPVGAQIRPAGVMPVSGGTAATALDTTGAPVDVSAAAPPSASQVLTATDATHATWQASSAGTVTSFGFTNANGFTGSVATSTTTPTLTLSWAAAAGTGAAGCFYGSPAGGSSGAITCRVIAAADVPTLNQNTSGSAATATTATNATNVATTQVSNSASYFPLFAASSTNGNQAADLGTGLTFNPSTNVLTTTTFSGALSGNATTATNTASKTGTGSTYATNTAPAFVLPTSDSLTITGDQSVAAWTTNGVRLKSVAGTLTDTTSSGTVATAYTNVLGGNTIAASSATTFTDYVTSYFKDPIAGSGATLTNKWALGADSLKIGTSNALKVSPTGVLTATSPVFTTPTLGVASATSINKVTLTTPATGSTLTIADGKTLAASNTLTLAGTDSTTMTFPTTSATIARTDAANVFTGLQTIDNLTGTSGALKFGAANALAPVAQALSYQGSRGGTDTNIAGVNATTTGSLGTGTAASGNLIFQTGTPQASGTTQHVAATNLTLSNAGTSATSDPLTTISGRTTFTEGTLTDSSNAGIKVSGTAPAVITATRTWNSFDLTGAGSSSQNQKAWDFRMLAGYTGSSSTVALSGRNNTVSTGTSISGTVTVALGAYGEAVAAGTGGTMGVSGFAGNAAGSAAYGVMGYAVNSATKVGVLGSAKPGGTAAVGGYFALDSAAVPTLTSAALMADNFDQTSPIFVARDNGTAVFTIADGGDIVAANGTTAGLVKFGTNSATPQAQTFTVADARGGTDTNTAGVNATTTGSLGTGTAASGTQIFTVGTPQASGTTQHVAATALTLSNTGVSGVAKPNVIFGGTARLAAYTVATLPTGTTGDTAYVTDALTPTYLTTAVGGGAVVAPVFFNGASWITF